MPRLLCALFCFIHWRELAKIVFEKRDAACVHIIVGVGVKMEPLQCGNKIQKNINLNFFFNFEFFFFKTKKIEIVFELFAQKRKIEFEILKF